MGHKTIQREIIADIEEIIQFATLGRQTLALEAFYHPGRQIHDHTGHFIQRNWQWDTHLEQVSHPVCACYLGMVDIGYFGKHTNSYNEVDKVTKRFPILWQNVSLVVDPTLDPELQTRPTHPLRDWIVIWNDHQNLTFDGIVKRLRAITREDFRD